MELDQDGLDTDFLSNVRRCAFATTVLVFSVPAALSLLAFAARSWWVFELLTHLRAHYFWALIVGGAIFAALKHFKLAAVFGAFALLNLYFVLPLYLPESRNLAEGRSIRLMNVNGYHYNPTRQKLIALIRETKPDVVLVLEVDDAWVHDLQSLAALYPHRHYEPRSHDLGIALLSRLPVDDLKVHYFGYADVPSITARLDDHDGNSFHLIGTHPLPPISAEYAASRNEQLINLTAYIQTLTGPVVVAGDLNSTSWSPYFRDFVRRTGLRDTRNGFGNQPTHPYQLAPIGIAIDHVLVSPEIAVRDRTVGPYIGSDHRPVIIDLVIPHQENRQSD
jgi:endonuclease/exonuclease/phosphatase (EEP) superfamily protein YafD